MTIKRSDTHLIILRRRAISEAKLRGMTLNQITIWLEEEGLVNPVTQRPWSINTISKDLQEIEKEWTDVMLKNITAHRARVLAEFGEVKNAAWKAGKLDTVLKAVNGEIALLGLNELERMGTEIALASLLKGLPEEVRTLVRSKLSKRLLGGRKSEAIPVQAIPARAIPAQTIPVQAIPISDTAEISRPARRLN